MAYHFRKLRQTLRLIPSTKSVGFTTRVNEGDQTKNSTVDGTSSALSIPCTDHRDRAPLCQNGSNSNDSMTLPICTVLRSPSDSDLLHQLQPPLIIRTETTYLPVSCKNLYQTLDLPASQFKRRTSTVDTINSLLISVKSVSFTSDDILVDPVGLHNEKITLGNGSTREKMCIDIINSHPCAGGSSHLATNPLLMSSGLDGIVRNNDNIQLFSGSSRDLSITHLYSSGDTGETPKPRGNGNSKDGPSPEQMHDAREKLPKLVNNLFKGTPDHEMLHRNVVMENNLFGDNKVAVGLNAYKLELFKLRLRIYSQFFSTSMEILSVTTLEQTGVVRIHWRLKGLPQIQNLKFWKLFWSRKSIAKEDWEWLEAFSYFHIGKDGLVHKHRIDRMMPDNESEPDLTEKLRGLLNPAKPLVS